MAHYNGIIEIARDLEHVLARFEPGDAAELVSLLRVFSASTEAGRDRVASEIARLVMRSLGPDDPVFKALNETRYAHVRQGSLAALFSVRLALGLPASDDPRERILGSQPVTAATELRSHGVDPDLPDLIRLPRPDGSVSVPDFQFDVDRRPRSVVLQVNRVLGAETDPWAVADWWVSGNVWLDAVPVTLVADRIAEPGLVAAATAAVDG
ncbi:MULTISPECIES: hypothetical protein [unclassified Amycolatopsis]|uniref:hypothetical protein n=1 Tax=unclassified Amycolatopsis TaxID=2618356 RepID=UPI0028758295|nr:MULTISPECIES: hypothetical protein [unclassified Amycolatopsis]MDS0133225.1 hypothetical protein [Amycolatopsis sp. 505]MDS0146455.1 hypothetical protein [Amycolatopsis sp. CM201R]